MGKQLNGGICASNEEKFKTVQQQEILTTHESRKLTKKQMKTENKQNIRREISILFI
jgi:hypothetical protein